jgi:hypothetical protein
MHLFYAPTCQPTIWVLIFQWPYMPNHCHDEWYSLTPCFAKTRARSSTFYVCSCWVPYGGGGVWWLGWVRCGGVGCGGVMWGEVGRGGLWLWLCLCLCLCLYLCVFPSVCVCVSVSLSVCLSACAKSLGRLCVSVSEIVCYHFVLCRGTLTATHESKISTQ